MRPPQRSVSRASWPRSTWTSSSRSDLLRFRFGAAGRDRGRPPKIYVASDAGVELSIPARRHELLAEILAGAMVLENQHGSARAASARVAHARGVAAARQVTKRMRRGRIGAERGMTFAEEVLTGCGFEPYRAGSGCIRLRNCPFHPLAGAHARARVLTQPRIRLRRTRRSWGGDRPRRSCAIGGRMLRRTAGRPQPADDFTPDAESLRRQAVPSARGPRRHWCRRD